MLTYGGASLGVAQVLHLPSGLPRWLDLRRLLFLGWVTIETTGYLAVAKVHYRPSHWGISGTRVHGLYIWPVTTPDPILVRIAAAYQQDCGNIIDHLDDDGHVFLNLILEYFQ